MRLDLNVRIDVLDAIARGSDLGSSHVLGAVNYLTLQI